METIAVNLRKNMKKKNQVQIQQGDTLFFNREKLPEGCKRRKNRTIALGEQTGHHHTFEDGVAVLDAPDGKVFVLNETDEPKSLVHQEHEPIIFEPGIPYEFGTVREKDYFEDMVREVTD